MRARRWASIPALVSILLAPGHAKAAGSEPDSLIESIARGVSLGRMEEVLLDLTGERAFQVGGEEYRIETRWSGTDGMKTAALYLEDELLGCGLKAKRIEYLGSHLEAIAFADSLHGWAVGDGGVILATRDGGRHWNRQGPASQQLHAVAALSSERAVATGRTGVIFRTEDGGTHWEWAETGSARLWGLSFVDSSNGWACGDDGDVFRTRDGGRSWEAEDSRTDQRLYAVSFVDTSRGWAVGRNGCLARTRDGGRSWNVSALDGRPRLFAVAFLDSLTGRAVGDDGIVIRTSDGGGIWETVSVDTAVVLYGLEFTTADRGSVVGEGGVIFETEDAGLRWRRITSGTSNDLKAIASAGAGAWIAGHGTLLGSDDGIHWEDREETVEDRWVNVIATLEGVVDPSEFYVVCAHFDDLSEMPLLRAPGADDNGTGTALVLSAARALSRYRFEKTLKFICFSGEEQGLRGSGRYASGLPPDARPLGVLNSDMVGYDPEGTRRVWISFRGDAPSRALAEVCSTMVAGCGLDLDPFITDQIYGASDHDSFVELGIPAVMLSHPEPTAYPYIHSIADAYDRLDVRFAREVTRLVTAAAAFLAVPVETAPGPAKSVIRLAGMNPNPFAEAVGIRYGVGDERGGPVRLRIYDVEGRLLRTLIDGTRAQGTAEVWWDGRDDAGRAVAPGVYFVRLDLRGAVETAKLVRVQ